MNKKLRLTIGLLLGFSSVSAFADACFYAEGKAFKDAQTIRKYAKQMGWKVGKASSITAGNFIKGKKILYPQDKLTVCLRETNVDTLSFRAQSSAADAGDASWTSLFAEKQ